MFTVIKSKTILSSNVPFWADFLSQIVKFNLLTMLNLHLLWTADIKSTHCIRNWDEQFLLIAFGITLWHRTLEHDVCFPSCTEALALVPAVSAAERSLLILSWVCDVFITETSIPQRRAGKFNLFPNNHRFSTTKHLTSKSQPYHLKYFCWQM